jgi:hypothetical protein
MGQIDRARVSHTMMTHTGAINLAHTVGVVNAAPTPINRRDFGAGA